MHKDGLISPSTRITSQHFLTNGLGDVSERVRGSIALLQLGQRLLADSDQVVVVAQVGGGVAVRHQHHLSVGMEGDVGGHLVRNGGIVLGQRAGLNLGEGGGSGEGVRARVGRGASLYNRR